MQVWDLNLIWPTQCELLPRSAVLWLLLHSLLTGTSRAWPSSHIGRVFSVLICKAQLVMDRMFVLFCRLQALRLLQKLHRAGVFADVRGDKFDGEICIDSRSRLYRSVLRYIIYCRHWQILLKLSSFFAVKALRCWCKILLKSDSVCHILFTFLWTQCRIDLTHF